MDKKSAKYWAYNEAIQELDGALQGFDERGAPKIVGDEFEKIIKRMQKKIMKYVPCKFNFDGTLSDSNQ